MPQPFGKYISQAGNTLMVRVPGFEQRNFHVSKSADAMRYRDVAADQMDYPLDKLQQREKQSPERQNRKRKKDQTLPPGVALIKYEKPCKSGSGGVLSYRAYVATWMVTVERDGVRKRVQRTKSFAVIKYGEQDARRRAIEVRNKNLW